MLPLSQRLQNSFSTDFFRLLSVPTAPVYVDCVEELIEAAGESNRLRRDDARHLIQEISARHATAQWTKEEGGETADVQVRASRVYHRLLEAGWLDLRPESLHEPWLVISPGLRPLLRMLRELSSDEVGELRSFAVTLESVCRTLETENVLDPHTHPAHELCSRVSDLLQRLDLAISQLHSVESIIVRFERRQLQSSGPAETLHLIYLDFAEGQHMVCYEALHRRGLQARLNRVRALAREAMELPATRLALAEGFATEFGLDGEQARLQAADAGRKLLRSLDGIRQRAESIDRRVAAFHQLSRQRYLYQSRTRGRRPELAKAMCDVINKQWAGKKFSELDGEPWFRLRTPEVQFYFGTHALSSARRPRVKPSRKLEKVAMAPADEAEKARVQKQQRLALTPRRAARLVRTLLPERGQTVSTGEMSIETEEALLDLLSAASYDRFYSAGERLLWLVALARRLHRLAPEAIPRDRVERWRVESFRLTRKT